MALTYKNAILEYLKEIEICLAMIDETQDITEVYKSFNYFIDCFVYIDKVFKTYIDDNLENIIAKTSEKLSDLLVDSVELINQDEQAKFLSLLDIIGSEYEKWALLLRKNLRYKIVVLGINEIATIIDKIIDSNKADIICYIDDSGKNVGRYINGKVINELNKISSVNFDYVLNVSNNNIIINKLKQSGFIDIEQFIDYNLLKNLILSSPEFYIKHFKFLSQEKKFTGILTGLSYIQKGVDEELLKGEFCNLANPGQDLFYDFEMFKYAYNFKETKKHLQYAIIGLSYYSFHYDLSLSSNEARVNYYYPLTKKMHNNKLANTYLMYQNGLIEIEEKILKKEHFQEVFKLTSNYFQEIINRSYIKEYNCQTRTNEELFTDIDSVKRDYNKNFPKTVKENKQILKEYLSFLQNNSIKPIIVICPMTKLYQAFTPKSFEHELYEIINELSSNYEFQFLDYYYSKEFDDSDFYDPSHMNYKGAKKFATILNRDIFIDL